MSKEVNAHILCGSVKYDSVLLLDATRKREITSIESRMGRKRHGSVGPSLMSLTSTGSPSRMAWMFASGMGTLLRKPSRAPLMVLSGEV